MTSPKPDAPTRSLPTAEERRARQVKQAEEGVIAWAEYRADQKAALDRMPKLRKQRLARDAKAKTVKTVKLKTKAGTA